MTLISNWKKLILSFVVIFVFYSDTYGQSPGAEDYGKGSFTLGAGTALHHDFSTLSRLQFGGRRFVNLSYNVSGDMALGIDLFGGSGSRGGIRGIRSLSVETGMTHMLENQFRTRLEFHGGPAFVWGDRDEFNQTLGLSTGALIISEPLIDGLGLGLELHGNINFQESFGGVRFLVQFTAY